MKFGPVPVRDAAGAVLAHSARLADGTLRKGCVLGPPEIARLLAAGQAEVLVARLEPGDVGEDAAAAQLAAALAGPGVEARTPVTGRVNLHACAGGLLRLDTARIQAANAVHEGLTVATLLPDTVVEEGQMLATVKIIPYAVPGAALGEAIARAAGPTPPVRVAPWCGITVGLVLTKLDGTPDSVLAKMRGAVQGRLGPLGAQLGGEAVVRHDDVAVAQALQRLLAAPQPPALLLVSGIAATVDRRDVVPAGIVRAGGRVLHAGMPVDPGNLLVLGELDAGGRACAVVGIPTCARSPKLNGFDFVLRRFAAGERVTPRDIQEMGVGGLLTEIESRPMPRDTRRGGHEG